MLDLSKLMVETKEVWVDYPDVEGFKVKVANISRTELKKLRDRTTNKSYDRKTRAMVESLDEELFVKEFTEATLKGWEGLTLEILETLILINTEGHDMKEEFLFNSSNSVLLVTHSSEFDIWLNEVVFDLDNFRTGAKRSGDGETGDSV